MHRDATTPPFTTIGHIARTHGLKGEMKVSLETSSPEKAELLDVVYLRNERGDFYPCRVAQVRAEGKGNRISFFVQFEHIADRSAAEALKGKAVFLETDKASLFFDEEEAVESFLDFEVVDEQNQSIGLIYDEMDTGAQVVIAVATTKGSLLIPVVDQFVSEIDEVNQLVRCKNLDLLDGI